MNERDFVEILTELGWTDRRDEVGDQWCTCHLDDRRVDAIPVIGQRPGYYRVVLDAWVSTKEFSDMVSRVYAEKQTNYPIGRGSNFMPMKLQQVTREDLVGLADTVLTWAKSQDIEQGLRAYRELPTDAKGNLPLCHLASLALHGDGDRLSEYQRGFERGDRLGFVPYITKDMINRAVELARQQVK